MAIRYSVHPNQPAPSVLNHPSVSNQHPTPLLRSKTDTTALQENTPPYQLPGTQKAAMGGGGGTEKDP